MKHKKTENKETQRTPSSPGELPTATPNARKSSIVFATRFDIIDRSQ
jgi:hypothetical protein